MLFYWVGQRSIWLLLYFIWLCFISPIHFLHTGIAVSILIPLSLCFCCYHRQRLEVKENVTHEKVILSFWSLSLVTIIAQILLLLLLLRHFSCVRLYNPTGQQPIRPFHPWDSPGNNTGAGCHFLLQCIHAC